MTKKKAESVQPRKRLANATLKERGLQGVLVPVSPEEHALIRKAAAECGMRMNQFVRDAAVKEALRVRPDLAPNGGKS